MRNVTLTILSLCLSGLAKAATPIEGYWRNPIGSAIIAIAPCGNALCGKVAWASVRGQREVAKNAPNVVGTTVLTSLRFAPPGWTGSLYIPDDNIRVAAKLETIGNRELKLTGCAIFGIFCRTQIWTRVDNLPPQSS